MPWYNGTIWDTLGPCNMVPLVPLPSLQCQWGHFIKCYALKFPFHMKNIFLLHQGMNSSWQRDNLTKLMPQSKKWTRLCRLPTHRGKEWRKWVYHRPINKITEGNDRDKLFHAIMVPTITFGSTGASSKAICQCCVVNAISSEEICKCRKIETG